MSPSPPLFLASTSLGNDQQGRGEIPLNTSPDRVATDKGGVEPEGDGQEERRESLLDAPAGRATTDKGTVKSEGEDQDKRGEIPLGVEV